MCIIQEEMFAEGGMLGTWSLQEPLDADTDDGFKDTLWTDTVSMHHSPHHRGTIHLSRVLTVAVSALTPFYYACSKLCW